MIYGCHLKNDDTFLKQKAKKVNKAVGNVENHVDEDNCGSLPPYLTSCQQEGRVYGIHC